MRNPTEIIPGVLFYAYLTGKRKEKVGFFEHSTLVLQVSGTLELETAGGKISTKKGEMLLIRKNQLGELTKIPVDGDYQTIVIVLKEDMLRNIALEDNISIEQGYKGPSNILIPKNDFLHGFFQSVIPYVESPEKNITDSLAQLKIKEAVQLLLHTTPAAKEFLFDFSEQHKIDLEKFMLTNYHFNIPVEKFAQLTGRSLAGFKRDFQKIFGTAPRHWLQEKRLNEAMRLIEKNKKKPSAIYLDLGFESLSHFSASFKKKFGKAPTEWLAV